MLGSDAFDRNETMTYCLVTETVLELHAVDSGSVLVVGLRPICLRARSRVWDAHCHLHIGGRRSDISLGLLEEAHVDRC